MININDITFRIGGRLLFDQATARVHRGGKVGLIGSNGSGKSTLFSLLLNGQMPDRGEIKIRKGQLIATVSQEAPTGSISLIEYVLSGDKELAMLLDQAETATDPHEIADVHERLADIEAQSAPARAAQILAGLGFDEDTQQQQLDSFSGGWRMRVALAATLFSRPDILLLDEPTNHLDLEASMWLESYLGSWRGTLVVISHDRTLLNRVVSEIIHIENFKLVRYPGTYDDFETISRERQLLDSKLRKKQIIERKRIQSFVDRFRYKATKARQAQSRLKMLKRMEPIAAIAEDQSINLDFPKSDTLPPPLITLNEVFAGYEKGSPVLKKLNLNIGLENRIGLLGANGNGKSTLMKVLAERLKPLGGHLQKSSKLRIGYFAQHQTEELDIHETAYYHAARLMPSVPESRVRAHLGRFGFIGEKANTFCANLSGGEKAKLIFALMSLDRPHMLLLDEPTNHLDVASREALVQALNAYEGAIVIVSHDPHLLNLVCDRFWLAEGGTCNIFDGDLDDYRLLLREAHRDQCPSGGGNKYKSEPKVSRKELRRKRAASREAQKHFRQVIRDLEQQIEELEKNRRSLEGRLASPEIYGGSSATLKEAQMSLAAIKTQLTKLESEWILVNENLDLSK